MVITYLILLFMYIVLTLLYVLKPLQFPRMKSWPLLTPPPPTTPSTSATPPSCQVDSDCNPYHVCLSKTCVPKLLRGGQCNPTTGRWISYHIQQIPFAICSCIDDQLYSQNFFGGDCTVNVACGIHGHYNPHTRACDCNPGYKAVGLSCQRLPAYTMALSSPCGPDEFEVATTDLDHEGFHPTYVQRLQPFKCVKRPCSFDAFTGQPLKQAKYERGWGCVCDPRYGLFGVVLDGQNKEYLTSPGFDGCASIFKNDIRFPIPVKYMTYFYLGDREPISIVSFQGILPTRLHPVLKGTGGNLMITQSNWRYDFAQHFFKTQVPVRARTRHLDVYDHPYRLNIEVVRDRRFVDHFKPALCRDIYRILASNHGWLSKQKAYDLLYKNPVCKVSPNDPYAHPMFKGKTVVNPHQVTYEGYGDELEHFNALVLNFVKHWVLDLEYPYNIDTYRGFRTNAPDYSDKIPPYP